MCSSWSKGFNNFETKQGDVQQLTTIEKYKTIVYTLIDTLRLLWLVQFVRSHKFKNIFAFYSEF